MTSRAVHACLTVVAPQAGGGDAEGIEYRVKASAGDSACGGIDMDYLVARALLVRYRGAAMRGTHSAGPFSWFRHRAVIILLLVRECRSRLNVSVAVCPAPVVECRCLLLLIHAKGHNPPSAERSGTVQVPAGTVTQVNFARTYVSPRQVFRCIFSQCLSSTFVMSALHLPPQTKI